MEDPPEDWNICQCCGTEFGYDDAGVTYAALRSKWVKQGAKWWGKRLSPPENWSAESQVASKLGLIAWESASGKANISPKGQVSTAEYNDGERAYSASRNSLNPEGMVDVQHGRRYSTTQSA